MNFNFCIEYSTSCYLTELTEQHNTLSFLAEILSTNLWRFYVNSNGDVEAEIEPLTLANIRESLIRQEDTIIYALLQRAQFSFNAPTYDVNSFSIPGFQGSLVEFMLKETETLHAKVSLTLSIFYTFWSLIGKLHKIFCCVTSAYNHFCHS